MPGGSRAPGAQLSPHAEMAGLGWGLLPVLSGSPGFLPFGCRNSSRDISPPTLGLDTQLPLECVVSDLQCSWGNHLDFLSLSLSVSGSQGCCYGFSSSSSIMFHNTQDCVLFACACFSFRCCLLLLFVFCYRYSC